MRIEETHYQTIYLVLTRFFKTAQTKDSAILMDSR